MWHTESAMEKPTIGQIVWVFEHLKEHLHNGGTFRSLIYDRMQLGPDAYEPLCEAGGKEVTEALDFCCRMREVDVEFHAEPEDDSSGSN